MGADAGPPPRGRGAESVVGAADRFTKRRLYQAQRTPCYWIIDAEERQAELWTPDASFPAFERDRLVWQSAGAAAALDIALEEVFRPI